MRAVIGFSLFVALLQTAAKPTNVHVEAGLGSVDDTNYCSVACFYVRPNGGTYGTENGTSWTNAFDGFSDLTATIASVPCGSTIWVAGGTYTQTLVPNKTSCSVTTSIRRARADTTAVTGSAGYSASFNSLITQTNEISFDTANANRFLISGRTSKAGARCDSFNNSGCGWLVDRSSTGTSGGMGIGIDGANSNNAFEYLELKGSGEVNHQSDHRGIDWTPNGTGSNFTFSHLYIHDWESAMYAVSCSGGIWEYIDVSNIGTTGTLHPNGLITWGCPNGIFRYNFFHRGTNTSISVGEGMFWEQAGGSTNWQVYGNIFWDITATTKALEITGAVGAIKIYNNTFDNISAGTINFTDSPTCASGEYRNNLGLSASHTTSGNGCTLTASNSITAASGSVFTNRTAHDYHIVSTVSANFPKDKGTSVSGTFTLDRDGDTMGGDGTWDVGAYEAGGVGGDDHGLLAWLLRPVDRERLRQTADALARYLGAWKETAQLMQRDVPDPVRTLTGDLPTPRARVGHDGQVAEPDRLQGAR